MYTPNVCTTPMLAITSHVWVKWTTPSGITPVGAQAKPIYITETITKLMSHHGMCCMPCSVLSPTDVCVVQGGSHVLCTCVRSIGKPQLTSIMLGCDGAQHRSGAWGGAPASCATPVPLPTPPMALTQSGVARWACGIVPTTVVVCMPTHNTVHTPQQLALHHNIDGWMAHHAGRCPHTHVST